jgi:haloalkane dehalogenase
MKVLRTPESQFANVEQSFYPARYVNVGELRVAYVDEGDPSAAPVLLMHGEPTWSYLYRHMIPVLTQRGFRAVAPDLVGFGRSDKPAARRDYSYKRQVDWMTQWLESVDLHDITLVCQDWGSLIGLRIAAENPHRFARIVLANGGLPTGDRPGPLVFKIWQMFATYSPWFPISRIVAAGCRVPLAPEVRRAYEAPFPGRPFKNGARALPSLVPTRPTDPAAPANKAAWAVLEQWNKPFLTAFSDGDPITRGLDRAFQRRVPGASDQPHTIVRHAGHFLQEDKGPELAELIARFIESTP